jgi:excinuclease ABC subunit A
LAEGKKLLSLILQDGFARIIQVKKLSKGKSSKSLEVAYSLGEMVDLKDPKVLKKGLPKDDFCLVIDRLAFTESEKGRIADSITQAYEYSLKYLLNATVRNCLVITTDGKALKLTEESCCPICGYNPPIVSSRLFSFNSPVGACPTCKGFGNILKLDEAKVVPNPKLSIKDNALNPFGMPSAQSDKKDLMSFCKKYRIKTNVPWEDLKPDQRKLIWDGNKDFYGVVGLFKYLDDIKYKMHVRVFISRYRSPSVCPDCEGSRLCKDAHNVFIQKYNIVDFGKMNIAKLQKVFNDLELSVSEKEIAVEVYKQISSRLDYLMRVGVHYLTLERETRTLSGGEYQRIMLANQLGMGLSQSLYVLDEPTVGLHPRDNDRLISILKDLKDLGNTLVVVEHDHDVIKNSDYVIEMGPGSGYLGGKVVYSGATKDFYDCKESNTSFYLKPKKNWVPLKAVRPVDIDSYKYKIELLGASGNNLKEVDLQIPLNRLVSITGVSGSGKSTLITHTLYPALARELSIDFMAAKPFQNIYGADQIKSVLLIDQSSIGKTVRSTPITYLKAFDSIRELYASIPEAKARGYTPGTFSLNVDGGRCPSCRGTGVEEIDMMFMDNMVIPCDVCDGKKYRNEILEIQYKGKNINEVLIMTVFEAMNFFVAYPNIRKPLSVLKEVGLDYLKLGQSASTLSGGESQRLKIAKEISQVQQKSTLYILDEPTTGLHFKEIELLMKVLNKLIEAGGSVIVVEHNLDVILGSDYIIDLGPDAGDKGGQIIATGTPEQIMENKKSLTGQYLKKYALNH